MGKWFSATHNRAFGFHWGIPFSNSASKALDPYINRYTINRLLKNNHTRTAAATNLSSRLSLLDRSATLCKTIIKGNFNSDLKGAAASALIEHHINLLRDTDDVSAILNSDLPSSVVKKVVDLAIDFVYKRRGTHVYQGEKRNIATVARIIVSTEVAASEKERFIQAVIQNVFADNFGQSDEAAAHPFFLMLSELPRDTIREVHSFWLRLKPGSVIDKSWSSDIKPSDFIPGQKSGKNFTVQKTISNRLSIIYDESMNESGGFDNMYMHRSVVVLAHVVDGFTFVTREQSNL